MRISLLAAAIAGCTAVLMLPPTGAVALDVPTAPTQRARTSVGGGSVTSLPLIGRGLAARPTRPFALIGVSWDDPAHSLAGGSVRVRVRSAETGQWSGWHELETDGEDGPDRTDPSGGPDGGRARGATTPLWTGPSDGVAVSVAPGAAGLPRGLRVELVDPGRGAEDRSPEAASPQDRSPEAASPEAASPQERSAQGTAALSAPRPGIVTRAGWGADESWREPGFVYTGSVRAVFVHHTATATQYACSDAPQVIRAIYQYHVQSNGWRDIGYNFLVDRCGTIYEGRAGGVDRPVHGAHTLGFNTDTSGVAALGTFSSDAPPQALLDGVSAISAWKLGLTGQDAAGRTDLVSGSSGSLYPLGTKVSFATISGHRDGFATECPGAQLYNRLGDIRGTASALQGRA
ncbi:N-acetylmuramoyl-L-alanine amidase [Kitasatospora sp. NPDC004240]